MKKKLTEKEIREINLKRDLELHKKLDNERFKEKKNHE